MHPAPKFPTALLGIALILGGVVLAADFRGFSTWNTKRAIADRCGGRCTRYR